MAINSTVVNWQVESLIMVDPDYLICLSKCGYVLGIVDKFQEAKGKPELSEKAKEKLLKRLTQSLSFVLWNMDRIFKGHATEWVRLQGVIRNSDDSPVDGYDKFATDLFDSLCAGVVVASFVVDTSAKVLALCQDSFAGHQSAFKYIVGHANSRKSEVQNLLLKVSTLWPWSDQAIIAKSQSEIESGLGMDVRDIVANLQR